MGVEVLVMARTIATHDYFRRSVRRRHSHAARWQLLAFQTRGTLGHLRNVSLSFTSPCCPLHLQKSNNFKTKTLKTKKKKKNMCIYTVYVCLEKKNTLVCVNPNSEPKL